MILNKQIQFILTAILFSGSLSAWALDSDRKQPIAVEADQGSLDQKQQVTTFSGNVVVKQGTLNIHAQTVKVSKNGQSQFMVATGQPVRFSQQLEKEGMVQGEARRVEYSSATNIVKLIGQAKVKRGGDLVEGETITYNTRTEVYDVSGSSTGKGNRRVTVVIQPEK